MSGPLPGHPDAGTLDDFVDGRIDAMSGARVAAHLEHCARCAGEVAETRSLLSRSQELRGAVHAPAALWSLVAASTIHVREARRQALRELRPVLVMAALALVAITAIVTWKVARSEIRGTPIFTSPRPPLPPSAPRPRG